MFPGTTSKLSESTLASATTIYPQTDLVFLTGSTAIATIRPSFGGGFSGILLLVPTDGALATTTAGNISLVKTMAQSMVTVFVYSKKNNIWYPGAIS